MNKFYIFNFHKKSELTHKQLRNRSTFSNGLYKLIMIFFLLISSLFIFGNHASAEGGPAGVDFIFIVDIAAGSLNAAPTATAPNEVWVTEDDTNVALANDIQVADADGDDQTLTFTITGGTLTIGTTGITFGGGGNGSSSFTAAGTLDAINTALDAATYTPTPNLSGTNVATILFTTHDGTVSSSAASVTFNIATVNDEPTLTATGTNPTFTEDGTAAIVFGSASASTVESGQSLIGFQISLTNVNDGASEILNVDGTAITLTNGTGASASLGYSVSVVGTTATITLTGGVFDSSSFETLINAISYQNNSNTPNTSNRVIAITSLTDSGSNAGSNDNVSALNISSTVTVAANNAAPTASSFTATPTQNSVHTFSTANFSYSDSDGDPINHLRVTAIPGNGTLYVDANASDSFDSGEQLSNANTVSKANLDAGNLQYYNTDGTSSSFTFDVNDGTDYSASTYTATLSVYKTPTITFSNITKTYGDANFNFGATVNSGGTISYSIQGADNGTSLSGTSNVTATLGNAGTVTIRATAAANGAYASGTKDITLTINKKALIAVAENKSREYGDANPAFTILYGSFVGSDTSSDLDTPPSASTTAIATTAVGTATIILSADSDDNYTITPTNGTLTINKAMLTATAVAKSRDYGDANPALTFTYGAFKNSETSAVIDTEPIASTTATTTTGAGTATIAVSGGSDNNYTFDYTSANLTINKARVTATAVAKSRDYGDANPALTFTYGTFKNSETSAVIDTEPTASTTATTTTGAGTATIAVSGGSDNNYTFDYTSANLTINKARLTATAVAKSRDYGDANPSLSFTYGTFKNSETSAVIDIEPTTSTTAIATTAVGTATITVSGGSDNNYTFDYTSANLTINKARPTVTTWPTASGITYGQDLSSAILSGGTASVVGSFAYDDSTIIPNTGTYSADIVFTPTDATNYITVAGNVDVIVNKEATITTQAVSDITVTTATANGNITDLGVPNPTSYGVCWSTSENPTTADSKDDKGAASATGAFTSSISSLSANTTYYVRAFVTNSAGTVYGEQMIFSTLVANDYIPVITANQSFDVDENAVNTASVGTVLASDADAGTNFSGWTIFGGTDADGIFSIDETSGEIKIADNTYLDAEYRQTYLLQIRVSDGDNLSAIGNVTINVVDINDNAPVISENQVFHIEENSPQNTLVATIEVTDADITPTSLNTISWVGGNTNSAFVLNPSTGEIRINNPGAIDSEANSIFNLVFTASDGVNISKEETITILIDDINEFYPIVNTSTFSVDENLENDTPVGQVLASDNDDTATFTDWTIISGNEDAIFAINANTGVITVVDNTNLDFERSETYTLRVSVSDGENTSSIETVSINVTDINEAPTAISLSNTLIAENTVIGIEVGTLTASDVDANETLTFTIVENEFFELTGDKIRLKGNLNFEDQASHSIVITVTDQDGLSLTKSFIIRVEDVNEAPTAISLSNTTIAENTVIGIEVGTLTASDVDANQTLTFTIVENEFFELTGDRIRVKGNLNFEEQASHSIVITVTDQDGLSLTQSLIIRVEDANEAPIFTSEAITEGAEEVEYVYTAECMDIDGDAISLVAIEKPEWLILVDNGDGTCTLSGTPALGGSYHVVLEASDSEFTAQQEFDIEVELVTGIEPDLTTSKLSIYPNPVLNELHIDISDFRNDETTISLFSMTGSLIFKETYQSIGKEVRIRKSLQHLRSGMYLLMIENDGSQKTYKIVKK